MSGPDAILRSPVLAGLPRRLGAPHAARPAARASTLASSSNPAWSAEKSDDRDVAGTADPLEDVRASAHAEGYAAGHAQGLAEARAAAVAAAAAAGAEQRAALGRLDKRAAEAEDRARAERLAEREAERTAAAQVRDAALQAARRAWDERLQELERAALSAAWTALCRLLGEQVERREALRGLVDQTLRAAAPAEPTRVRLHPADLALLRAGGPLPDDALAWSADPALAPLACEVDTPRGLWAADVDHQLQTLRDLWQASLS